MKNKSIENLQYDLKKFSYFQLNKKNDILIPKENVNNYLIIRQLVEISEFLSQLDISYTVNENNGVKLHIN